MALVISPKSYEHFCRTCMNEDSTFDIFMETLDSKNFADILKSCTGINVKKEDYLPKKICGRCYSCLVNFYHFREIAAKMDTKFREIFSNIELISFSTNESEIVQTMEIKIENTDTDCFDFEPKIEINIEDNQMLDENKNSDIYHDTNALQKLTCKKKKVKEKLMCVKCNKIFRKPSRFQDHMKEHDINNFDHKDSNKLINMEIKTDDDKTQDIDTLNSDTYPCRHCPSKFKSTNSLSAHMRIHAKKGRILACSVCNKVFKKMSHLKRHELMHDRSHLYQCSKCPRAFRSEETLKGHMNKHNGIKPHACPLCPKAFHHLATLTTHIQVHKKDKNLCQTCGKRFDSVTNLEQHVKRHLGLKKFECNLCPKKFVTKGELKSHSTTHTGERSHTCDQCGATFTKNSTLTKHILRHLGIKPHSCETCSMKFSSKDHLKRHNRIHTGEKPYKCDICERAFTQSNDLVKHRRAHLGEKLYKCTECSESFRLQTELRQHISDHFVSSRQRNTCEDIAEVAKEPDVTKSLNPVICQDENS